MVSEIFMCHADTFRVYMYTKEFRYVSLICMYISLLFGLHTVCDIILIPKRTADKSRH